MLHLVLRHDHRGAFFDGLLDELVAIAFFPAQCDEKAIPLHTPRVIRDAFHDAIKRPDDLAGGNGCDESFELHAKWSNGRSALNGVTHGLRPLVPRESLFCTIFLRLKIEITRRFFGDARKDRGGNEAAIIQLRVLGLGVIQHDQADEFRIFGRQVTGERDDDISRARTRLWDRLFAPCRSCRKS